MSLESGSQSTCRIWLDASTLTTFADGDEVDNWPDVSLSSVNDAAVQLGSNLVPTFRDDAANTINGFPVLTFDDGRFLVLNSTSDLNLQSVSNSKTVFFAFRTSTDVNSKQILYEEGGTWRGLNTYIHNGFVYVGGYDLNPQGVNNSGNRDGDNTPQWGYSFARTAIQPNTTYVLTLQFWAQSQGVVVNSPNPNDNYYIRGWLNGAVFDVMDFGAGDLTNNNGANNGLDNGIGTLWAHPDPIGLGGLNNGTIDRNGTNTGTGESPFKGRLAELCYYNDRLNAAERIIIENYLGAKYFANNITNDRYEYQGTYGNEVIGIGQTINNASFRHALSQGRTPFLISPSSPTFWTSPNQFFLTGHDGGPFTLTSSDVPNNSSNIERIQRIWRVDETGTIGSINLEIDSNDLPSAPAGFTRLVLLVDENSPNFPDFSSGSTVVREIRNTGGTTYEIDYDFSDNSFFTIGWLRPEVSFDLEEENVIEADAPATTSYPVTVNLNYQPNPFSGSNSVDYFFVDAGQTAEPADYSAVSPDLLTIPAGMSSAQFNLDIVNDNFADETSTESFLIIIDPNGTNTLSSGLSVGEKDTLVFSILDDDPPPKVSFVGTSESISEGIDSVYIKVRRTGNPTDMASTSSQIAVRRIVTGSTATYNVDYALPDSVGWVNSQNYPPWVFGRHVYIDFPAENTSSQIDSVKVSVLDDIVDEENEIINLRLQPLANAATDASSVLDFGVTLVDDDPEPQVNFLVDNQTGYESVGDPVIFVELDRPSTRDVEVDFTVLTAPSTATFVADYNVNLSGVMQFPPGDTLSFPQPFTVDNGDAASPAPGEAATETVIFQLTGASNASLGSITEHTYTIVDTSPFQWKGAAGVGKDSDNIVWIDADRMSDANDGNALTSIPNYSPRDIDVDDVVNNNNRRARLRADQINGRKAIEFSTSGGSDYYQIDDNSFTNLAGFVEHKVYFFVIRPDFVPSTEITGSNPNNEATDNIASVIYEQGAGTRGISIYLYDDYLWMHTWNDANDDGAGNQAPWGYDGNTSSTKWARSADPIVAGQTYVVSCHYNNFENEALKVYVNGKEGTNNVDGSDPNDIGRLYAHGGDIAIGAVKNGCRFHFTRNDGDDGNAAYDGLLAEFIKFHEPQFPESRRIIVENYLSAKYNIPLDNTDTPQIFDPAFAGITNNYNQEVAGVGIIGPVGGGNEHLDAQGPTSDLRIKDPLFSGSSGSSFAVWGHNGDELTNTWPFSWDQSRLPPGINERSGKLWKIFVGPTDRITSARVLLNFSESNNSQDFTDDPSLLKLLVSNDPEDFSSATVINAAQINSGFVAQFDAVPISNGMYLTLGNSADVYFNSPLPIELLDFNARLNGPVVDLSWATATEINNEKFIVERAGADLVWEEILAVPGAGNSTTTLFYNEKDRNPLKGVSYYRLKQVDYDGTSTTSDIVSVFNPGTALDDELSIYPNPSVGNSVFLRIPELAVGENGYIEVFDISGKARLRRDVEELNSIEELSHGGLPAGVYLVSLRSNSINQTRKLVIQ